MTAFVVGNGVSRQALDLETLARRGAIYGCNMIYREAPVSCLVATDRPVADHIQDQGWALTHRFYTRRPRPHSGALPIPQPWYGFSSGPVALALASEDHCDPIYLVGFDMGPDRDGTFNNVYAGEEFYKRRGAAPTYTGNWCRQIQEILNQFRDRRYVRVCGDTTARHLELNRLANLEHISVREFLERINTPKEQSCPPTSA